MKNLCKTLFAMASLAVMPAWAGGSTPYADYLRAMQALPAQLPAPRLEETGMGAMCEEGAAAEAAKQAALVEQRDEQQAALEPQPGVEIISMFAPDESPEMACAARVHNEFASLRLEQQRLARDYVTLRIKTSQGRQPCRPASGGEDPAELKADCDRSVQEQLAKPFAESAAKLWPPYWINTQGRIERLRRQIAECTQLRELAQNDAFKAGAQRRGNAAMAAFMRATREPVVEFAQLRREICHAVEAPARAAQWGVPVWVTYGPAQGPGGQPVPNVFSLQNLP